MRLDRHLDKRDWMALGFISLAVLCWTAYAGKDLSWDVYNHHFYLPFALLSGRDTTDFFGAGPQSYQNALGYLPGYLLAISLGLPSWLVGVILGTAHALCVFFAYKVADRLWEEEVNKRSWVLLATAMAFATPAYLLVAGTTSIDPTSALLVLAGLTLIIGGSTRIGIPQAIAAGFLVAVAFSLKQSNAVFVVSLAAVLLQRWMGSSACGREFFGYLIGCCLAMVLFMGYWSASLWHQFQSPLFPLYNNLFHSPYAPQEAVLASRFAVHEVFEYVMRLWDLAKPKSYIASEVIIPDIRPLALAVFSIIAAVFAILRSRAAATGLKAPSAPSRLCGPDAQLASFVLISYVLWLKTSGNARYALPLLLMVGVLLVRLIWMTLPLRPARATVMVLLLLQGGNFIANGDSRLAATPWDSDAYINVKVPEQLIREPYLHLTIQIQTNASIAPFLNHDGALLNPIGQLSLSTAGPVGERMNALMKKWRGRTRVLLKGPNLEDPITAAAYKKLIANILYRLRLDVNWQDCLPIQLQGNKSAVASVREPPLLSCAAIERAADDPSFEIERQIVDPVFDAAEAACPSLFKPSMAISERGVGKWQRFYPNSDAIISVSLTDGVDVKHSRTSVHQRLGSIEEVLAGKNQFKCQRWSSLAPD